MIGRWWIIVRNHAGLIRPAGKLIAGRWFWLSPLFPVLWVAWLVFRLWMGWRPEGAYTPPDVQGALIGLPMTVLALLLGVRIIAGEIDRRTLEIAYTVPGGAHRVWIAKLMASFLVLVLTETILATIAGLFLVADFPIGALYGAMQAAVFYMVLAMTVAAWFRSEATGALVTAGLLTLNGFFTGFGQNQVRISPFWNPLVMERRGTDPTDLLAWTVQNRIGFVIAVVAVAALAFARAERREKMLGR